MTNLKVFEFSKEELQPYVSMFASIRRTSQTLPQSMDAYNEAVDLVTRMPVPYSWKKKNQMCLLIAAYSAVTGTITKVHPIVSALIGEVVLRNKVSDIPIEYYLQSVESNLPVAAKEKTDNTPTLLSAMKSQLRLNIEFPTETKPVVPSTKEGYFLAYVEDNRCAVLSQAVYATLGRITRLTADDEGIKAEGSVLIRKVCDEVLTHRGLLKDDFILV